MISFGIITDGKEPEKLLANIYSIKSLGISDIWVCGDIPDLFYSADICASIQNKEAAQAGRLGEMRNILCENAKYDTIVISDDDILFHHGFDKGIPRDFDVLACRLLNTDGSRFWDWAKCTRGASTLLSYDETHNDVYVTGGLCVLRKKVFDEVKWDSTKGFYQGEDVDFSQRIKQAGFKIEFAYDCVATHNDSRYTQQGNYIAKR